MFMEITKEMWFVQNFKMARVHRFTTKPSSSMTTYDIIEQY